MPDDGSLQAIALPYDNILQTIGCTPRPRINRLFGAARAVYVKSAEPVGSITDRLALAMVEAAQRCSALAQGGTIIEPTSGNTSIGLAMVAAVKGHQLVLLMPDGMSIERRRLMLAHCASMELTPLERACMARSRVRPSRLPRRPVAGCCSSEKSATIDAHLRTTAEEIAADFPQGVDTLTTGVGTGGHNTWCERLRQAK